jgi:hypothetical protein
MFCFNTSEHGNAEEEEVQQPIPQHPIDTVSSNFKTFRSYS